VLLPCDPHFTSITFRSNLLVLAKRDMSLVFFALLLQLLILILNRSHDGLDSRGKHDQKCHNPLSDRCNVPSSTQTMWRVYHVKRILFNAKLAPEISLVVEVAGPDDALVGMRQDLEARSYVSCRYDFASSTRAKAVIRGQHYLREKRFDSRQLSGACFSGSLHGFRQHVLRSSSRCTRELQRPLDLLAMLWSKLCQDKQPDDLQCVSFVIVRMSTRLLYHPLPLRRNTCGAWDRPKVEHP
jgi:hypothetical protein